MTFLIPKDPDPAPPGVVIVVTGGRDYNDREHVYTVLDRVHRLRNIRLLIEGGCPTGADFHARSWCADHGVPNKTVAADWSLGRRAGPLRNREMIAMRPNGVVVFKGGRGTEDCARAASEAGVVVWRV